MRYIEDENLEFLKFVKSEDLNELVKILTAPKTEELTSRDIYKVFNPEHRYYWQEIAAELQYFGGNSISNVVRRNGVKYIELLRDVCEALKIDITYDPSLEDSLFGKLKEKVTNKIENTILGIDTFYSTEILENNLLSNAIDKDTLSKKYNPKISLKNKDVLIATVSTPVFLLKRISDPNFEVTVKAVFEIAQLRKNYVTSSKQVILEKSSNKNIQVVYNEIFVINDEQNAELGQLKVIDSESVENINFENPNEINIDKIKQLLGDTIKNVISIPNQTVELVFTPEVQRKLAEGTYTMIESRAIVKDGKGVIKEHAQILKGGQTKQLLAGGYQLLSIVVAQSHLADIEKNLSDIKSLIEQVHAKLEAEDKAQINGAIKYIVRITSFIRENDFNVELSQVRKQKIEDIIYDISKWESKLLEELQGLNKRIHNLGNKDTFGSENTYLELKKLINNIEPLKVRYKLILKLSSVLLITKKLLDPNGNEFSDVDIQFEELKEKLDNYEKFINDKVSIFKSYFNSNNTLEERERIINILQDNHKSDFETLTLSYQKQLHDINEYFDKFKNGKTSVIISLNQEAEIDNYAINYL